MIPMGLVIYHLPRCETNSKAAASWTNINAGQSTTHVKNSSPDLTKLASNKESKIAKPREIRIKIHDRLSNLLTTDLAPTERASPATACPVNEPNPKAISDPPVGI